MNEKQLKYEQVGVIALRNPDGTFQPSTPIYQEVNDSDRAAAERTLRDVASIFAEKLYKVKKAHERLNNKFI